MSSISAEAPLQTGTGGDNGVIAPFQEACPCVVSVRLSETSPVLGRDRKHEVAWRFAGKDSPFTPQPTPSRVADGRKRLCRAKLMQMFAEKGSRVPFVRVGMSSCCFILCSFNTFYSAGP